MFFRYDEAYKQFIFCELFKAVCEGEHLHFFNKIDQHSNARYYETRSNVGNSLIAFLLKK